MNPEILSPDVFVRVAPLGVRFWDVSADAPAGDGIVVTVYPEGVRELRRNSVVGRSGIHSFHALPGLSALTFGDGSDAWWALNSGRYAFQLEFRHIPRAYLPFRVALRLPHRGLFGLLGSPALPSLTPDDTWLPVFSSPARITSSAAATIRAELFDLTAGRPAAWTLCEARAGSTSTAYGLADERGILAMSLPYPEPENFGLGSPFGGARIPVTRQNWTVSFRFFYSAVDRPPELPELGEILSQRAAAAWQNETRTLAFTEASLRFGEELVLHSTNPAGDALPRLLITQIP